MTPLPSVLCVRLPWPHKNLSPNARVHWGAKSRSVKAARSLAFYHAFDSRRLKPDGELTVSLLFTPPTNRARDADNLIASCKPYFDGIAEAMGVNDKRFKFGEISISSAMKPGSVVVTISEAAVGVDVREAT